MADKIKETDKAILERALANPTVKAMRQAGIAENRKREEEIRQSLAAPTRRLHEGYDREMAKLKADLAEARAQIAAKDAELDIWILGHAKLQSEHQAQIAAKDAALRAIRIHTIAIHVYDETSLMIKEIDKALAVPARETE